MGRREARVPDPDAYGRVTNPGRYRVVAEAAWALAERLASEFDVAASVGDVATDFPGWPGSESETIRLVPAEGVPITFLLTDFPGALIRFGVWGREPFPSCGCDACDEDPAEEIDRMAKLVEAAVAGEYRERMTRRWLTCSFAGPWGSRRNRSLLRRRDRERPGRRGTHDWPPWTRRSAGNAGDSSVGG